MPATMVPTYGIPARMVTMVPMAMFLHTGYEIREYSDENGQDTAQSAYPEGYVHHIQPERFWCTPIEHKRPP